jgi:hypothetical protein
MWDKTIYSGRNTSDCCLSPPSHFFFVQKQKKNCVDKNPLANDVKKHVGLIFSPAGETLVTFSDVQTVISKKVFSHSSRETKCNKMRIAFCRILSHAISQHTDDIAAHFYPTKMVITLTLTLPKMNYTTHSCSPPPLYTPSFSIVAFRPCRLPSPAALVNHPPPRRCHVGDGGRR